ncbi:hypothetical protein MMC08_003852 [Hypocenomyce scalaris]|nr:hypothetical protein [Hypocenomyce scalaris]
MTSGTTFAARARAAELNAVRARKASKELESDEEVPANAPVSLGTYTKFTKPRNRNKAWKTLNLDEVPETPAEPFQPSKTYTTFGELSFPTARGKTGNERQVRDDSGYKTASVQSSGSRPLHLNQNLVSSVDSEPELSPESKKLACMVAGFDLDEWDPDMPPATMGDSRSMSRASSNHLAPHQHSHPIITYSPSSEYLASKEIELTEPSAVALREQTEALEEHGMALIERSKAFGQEAKLASLRVHPSDGPKRLGEPQEARLAQLGVLPPVHRAPTTQTPLGNHTTMPPPFTPRFIPSNEPYGVQTDSYLNIFGTGVPQPGYGSMDFNFRFPHGFHTQQRQHSQVQQGPTDYFMNVNQYSNNSMHLQTPPREYSPAYNGNPASSKKEMLLQGLHDVVESSKAAGSISSSARTVLYDPEARSNASQAAPANVAVAPVASKTEKELLLASEELPWKDRPVNIHTVVTPILSNADLAALNKASTLQITPPTLAAGEKHRAGINLPSNGRLDEAERWWQTDVRGQGEVRNYVEHAADSHLSIRIAQAAKNTKFVRPQPTLPDYRSANPARLLVPNVTDLLIPLLANLHGYVSDTPKQSTAYFGRYSRVPEWCIDKTQGGENSFFGEDWGAPPPRVGRDPRYRPLLHEGRYTVFDEVGAMTSSAYRW